MKPSTERTIKYSAYFVSLTLLCFSGYQLSKKHYQNAGLLAFCTLPILTASYLGPKLDKEEDEFERDLERRAREDYNKAA